MITFSCVCGKAYSVDDSKAGKTGTCRACGARMIVPIFVPTPTINLRPRRQARRSWSGIITLIAGIAIALIVVYAISVQPSNGLFALFVIAAVGVSLSLPLLAVILPVVASRRGKLSLARWLILAAAMGLAMAFMLVMVFLQYSYIDQQYKLASMGVPTDPSGLRGSEIFTGFCFYLAVIFGLISFGSLLAAAFHPKTTGNSL